AIIGVCQAAQVEYLLNRDNFPLWSSRPIVNSIIQELIARAQCGGEDEFQELVAALRLEEVPTPELVALLRSQAAVARRAGVLFATDRSEQEIVSAVAALAEDSHEEVRRTLAETAQDASGWTLPDVIRRLLKDDSPEVREAAVLAASQSS